jgi:hypothetical protein
MIADLHHPPAWVLLDVGSSWARRAHHFANRLVMGNLEPDLGDNLRIGEMMISCQILAEATSSTRITHPLSKGTCA